MPTGETYLVADTHIDRLVEITGECAGVDLARYRRSLLARSLGTRMDQTGHADPQSYLHHLKTHPSEREALVAAIAVNVSFFFRDPIVFELLEQTVFPRIIESKRQANKTDIRVWSAGCAAGEEPYSIAILLDRALKRQGLDWTPLIFATDIDANALADARLGTYPQERLEHVKLGILDEYFEQRGDAYAVKPSIREMVQFSADDVTSTASVAPADSIFGAFDLVLCRNVLIYFARDVQEAVTAKLWRSVVAGGYAVLGGSETFVPEIPPTCRVIDRRNQIYQKARGG